MKAMIFSAGLGTRFKPWTDHHPKALALVHGKPLLQWNIEYLQRFGINDIIVNVHHFADQVAEAIRKNDGWGSRVQISDEQDLLLDTGGGLLKAKSLFTPGERFVTCNVDILTDLDLLQLMQAHLQQQPLVSFGVTDRKTSRYLLFDDQQRLCGWRNSASGEEIIARPSDVLIQKAYSCVVIFEYEIFRHIELTGKFSLIDLYLQLAGNHEIRGFDHSGGRWVDVGRPESVAIAEKLFPA
jgi:MurNAc alpha-1-phosphate uridylyltransferase